MGLTERRALKSFQETQFPELKRAIEQAAGFAVPVEVSWDSLAKDDMSHLYAEAFPKVYFAPIIDALKSVCTDDMGRDALKKSLKKVVICNTAGHSSSNRAISFEAGVLTVDHDPVCNINYGNERLEAIVKILEKAL